MLSMVSDVCLSWWRVRKGTDMTGQQRAWTELALEVEQTHNEGLVEKGEFWVAGFWGHGCVKMLSIIGFKEIWSWEHLSERTAKNWALLYLELPTNQWFCSIYMEESYHIMQVQFMRYKDATAGPKAMYKLGDNLIFQIYKYSANLTSVQIHNSIYFMST